MSYDPDLHQRRSIRLRSYDYSWSGTYFITIIVRGRQCLFGDVEEGTVHLNEAGLSIERNWLDLQRRFPFCDVGEWVVIPNHFHGVLIFHSAAEEEVPATPSRMGGTTKDSLGRVMQAFKSLTPADYISGIKKSGWPPFERKLWLRNY